MKTETLLLLGGGAVGLYLLTNKSGGSFLPGGSSSNTGSNAPTTYGINGGYSGVHAAVVANYAAIVAADPRQANPNYQLTSAEAQQYLANYSDIQGVSTWPGGLSQANLQKHWTLYGVSQQRIFLPLQPPSTAPYIPPVQNPKSSGGSSSFLSSALGVVTTILPFILGASEPHLNNAEVQLLMTGGAIIKDILPMYRASNRDVVDAIDNKLNDLLTQYS